MAVKLLQASSEDRRDFVPLVNTLGIHFQIRDDYINLQSDQVPALFSAFSCSLVIFFDDALFILCAPLQYMKGKGYCEDITEGKFSFPIIHCVQHDKHHRLLNILKQKTSEHDVLRFAVQCIQSTNSFEYTVSFIKKIEKQAWEEIGKLGGNPKLSKILEGLSEAYKEPVQTA